MSELVSDQAAGGPDRLGSAGPGAGVAAPADGDLPEPGDGSHEPSPAFRGRALPAWAPTVALVGLVAVGIVARFVTRSNLWLDEALSVNIATLDPGDLLDALRHDGHPPLYYVLLHYWMSLVGEGDFAVRALSGVFAVASLPLAWLAGRRIAGLTGARWTLALVALSPFWIRYASEARMYSLVMLLVLAGYLVMGDALRRATPLRLGGLAVISGLLLLAHYWAFWLVGAVVLVLAWRWRTKPAERRTTAIVTASVAAGGVLFLPWVPSFLYQAGHTGTPWAGPMRPLAIVELTLVDMGGGGLINESFFYGATIVLLCLAAVLVVASDGPRLSLDLRTVPGARVELAVVALTIGLGCLAAYASSSTFQARYAAMFVPLVYLVVAVGLARLPTLARGVLGGVLLVLSLVGIGWNLYFQRTQSVDVAAALADHAEPGDVVVYCPDQLGPAFSRVTPDDLEQRSYPLLDSPERVDWVDYADRNAEMDADEIAAEVRAEASDRNIFVVWRGSYATFDLQCEELVTALSVGRPTEPLVSEDVGKFYEPANVHLIRPASS